MTYFYYIAANIPMENTDERLLFERSTAKINGLHVPLHFEWKNGMQSIQEAEWLLAYLYEQCDIYPTCTFQFAKLAISEREPLRITQKAHLELHKLKSAAQLLLEEGQSLTLRKVRSGNEA